VFGNAILADSQATFDFTGDVPDTIAPVIDAVSAADDIKRVTVSFSEKLDEAKAETAVNYQISNDITVTGATLAADGRTVTLATSTLAAGIIYTLTVNAVTDLSGNAIVTNSQATFEFTGQPPPPPPPPTQNNTIFTSQFED
jgi:hypothetical protein